MGVELEKKEIYVVNYRDGFKVDIVVTEEDFVEFWLYHKDYAVKEFLFGVKKESDSVEDYVVILLSNIEENIKLYSKEHMDQERIN